MATKQFCCPICKQWFKKSQLLIDHAKATHGMKYVAVASSGTQTRLVEMKEPKDGN